ncbi:MAG: hypothetical protein WAM97_11215 [Acidimicrobiales bacterium]
MSPTLAAGARLRSSVCTTEVVVVKASNGDVDLRCGGSPMLPVDSTVERAGEPESGFQDGTPLGKRYVDESSGLELLCTKAGPGSLSVGDQLLTQKTAKPLPSSD